jgi:hypothetical protein
LASLKAFLQFASERRDQVNANSTASRDCSNSLRAAFAEMSVSESARFIVMEIQHNAEHVTHSRDIGDLNIQIVVLPPMRCQRSGRVGGCRAMHAVSLGHGVDSLLGVRAGAEATTSPRLAFMVT